MHLRSACQKDLRRKGGKIKVKAIYFSTFSSLLKAKQWPANEWKEEDSADWSKYSAFNSWDI